MNKTLLRQLKRSIGLADEAAVHGLLDALRAGETTCPEVLRGLHAGFGDFLSRIEASYEQFERDLELRTRSLELSSQELSGANEKLRHELSSREAALKSLRTVLRDLLPDDEGDEAEGIDQDDIAVLSLRIVELVQEREASRRALDNQKFALDQHAIVSITDTAGTIRYANDRFCEISGFPRDVLLGQSHRIVNSGVHPRTFFSEMWETLVAGQVWHGEICNRSSNGDLYWVNATIVPLLDAGGLPEQYIAIRTDITDRKRMEGQLSEQLHLVEELIEAIPLPVYMKNADGQYLRINRAFELFFGTQRERLLGKTLHDLLTRPEDIALHAGKDDELRMQGGVQSYEAVVQTRDGIRHDTIYRKAALRRRDGSYAGLLGTIIDITDRKQAEVELLQAKEAAEAASKAKSEFLANMSHEIRTPMNGIIGMTDLALDTALTEEQREYMSIVKSSAESLLTVINDILDFSKIEAGKLLVENISFDLHRLISETLKTLSLRAFEKHLELISDITPEVPHHVISDPGRVRQVLINLVGNAIKFTERGEVALRVEVIERDGEDLLLHLAVRDTGIGIAPDKQQLIFDAFSQEDTSTTRRYGGTGLGLTISRRLVELMGGSMWLDSVPGQGSTFHFSIRVQPDAAPAEVRIGHVALRGRCMLLVDDNATNRRVLSGMLEGWGIAVRMAASGAEALGLACAPDAPAFDCIILDAHMPEMDGYELATELRQRLAVTPKMMMLSSGAMRGDAQRCEQAGIAGFFSKPIAAEELLAALCRVLGVSDKDKGQPLVTRHVLREQQRPLTVLLVEDHPVNQKLALGLLEKWGHHATLAVNGQEAVDMTATHDFDVVLMDMQMPVMGGIDATLHIRAREEAQGRPPLFIIAMTAAAMQSDREACLAAGMNDYIAKPVKAQELMEKLLALGAGLDELAVPHTAYDYGVALANADQESVEIIAELFLETYPRDIATLRQCIVQTDPATFMRTAHSLKGTLQLFGAEPAARVAADLEQRALTHPLADLASEISTLEHEVACLVPHLQSTVQRISG